MKSNHTTIRKALLLVVPAVLLAFVLQSVVALAWDTATVYYKINPDGGAGTITIVSEPVELSTTADPDQTSRTVFIGKPTGTTVEPQDGYEVACWTADKTVYAYDQFTGYTAYTANTALPDSPENYYVTEDTTFTVTIVKSMTYDVTYKADSNGYITDGQNSEEVVDGGSPVSVPTPKANEAKKYAFAYWTADRNVTLTNGSIIQQGAELTTAQLLQVKVTSEITFTANFAQKAADVNYLTDGGGSVNPTYELVTFDTNWAYLEDEVRTYPLVGEANIPTPTPNKGFTFKYWQANADVYEMIYIGDGSGDAFLRRFIAWSEISAEELQTHEFYVGEDTTFTAIFERNASYNVAYESAGHGSVSPTDELVTGGTNPKGPTTITPDADYEFDFWTANADVEVEVPSEDDTQSATITIPEGSPIQAEQLSRIVVTKEITLTANFKPVEVPPEPYNPDDPDNPDGGDTIKPADGADGKLVPKTGDTLPGVTAAVVLGAGAVVAGAALLKKRCR